MPHVSRFFTSTSSQKDDGWWQGCEAGHERPPRRIRSELRSPRSEVRDRAFMASDTFASGLKSEYDHPFQRLTRDGSDGNTRDVPTASSPSSARTRNGIYRQASHRFLWVTIPEMWASPFQMMVHGGRGVYLFNGVGTRRRD